MESNTMRPLKKRRFRGTIPCNLALACFAMALGLHAGNAAAETYNIGGGGAGLTDFANLNSLFTSGPPLLDGDTIKLYQNDASLGIATDLLNPMGETLTIQSATSGTLMGIGPAEGEYTRPAQGGLLFVNNNGTLILQDLSFSSGKAQGLSGAGLGQGLGGAIYGADALSLDQAKNLQFSGNIAAGPDSTESAGYGGAISVLQTLEITNSNALLFVENQALGGNTSGLDSSSGDSGKGGAIQTSGLVVDNVQTLRFEGNIAQGGNAESGGDSSGSGHGGAIEVLGGSITNTSSLSFENNQAIGGDSSAEASSEFSGVGGAIAAGILVIDDSSDISFTNNQAIGGNSSAGSSSQGSGLGGAVFANELSITDSKNISFIGNLAQGGNSTGEDSVSSNSGEGGAILSTTALLIDNVENLFFKDNQAIGGDASSGGNASGSGMGGAISSYGDLSITGSKNVVFEGNSALGGNYVDHGWYGHSGLGGAIFSWAGDLVLEDVVFLNNSASTLDNKDATSGRGGAIFIGATDQNTTFRATTGNTMLFSGNTHSPGGGTLQANSIYFGNISTIDNLGVTAVFDVEQGGKILMYDPMGSQQDGLDWGRKDTEPGDPVNNISLLTINKTGDGIWQLAGHNDMRSSTIWTVEQGTMHLGNENTGTGAHIDLSHDTTAEFILKSGSVLLAEPVNGGNRISAQDITLESGSTVTIGELTLKSSLYTWVLYPNNNQLELLRLEAENSFANNSTLVDVADRSFYRNAYDYEYKGAKWNDDGTVLTADINARLNPERGAISATTAPSAIAVQQPFYGTLFRHMDDTFRNMPKSSRGRASAGSGSGLNGSLAASYDDGPMLKASFAPGAGGSSSSRHASANNLWFTPGYSYTDQSGSSNYEINTPSFALGYDRWVEDSIFIGVAFSYARPEYESTLADVDADSYLGAIYGGALIDGGVELSGFFSFGVTSHDQDRRVYGLTYTSDYDADMWALGLGLARPFAMDKGLVLRPFVSYEYIQASIDGYNEHGPTATSGENYALSVSSHDESMHRVQAGLGVNWRHDQGFFFSGRAAYVGLYGDRTPETSAYFSMDPGQYYFTSVGDSLDEHSLGLGLQFGVFVVNGVEFSVGYNLLMGEDSTTHQGNFNLMWSF